jgi:hypothetical protein
MSKQTYKHTNKQKLDKGSEIVLYTCQPLTYADSVCVCVWVCVCVHTTDLCRQCVCVCGCVCVCVHTTDLCRQRGGFRLAEAEFCYQLLLLYIFIFIWLRFEGSPGQEF